MSKIKVQHARKGREVARDGPRECSPAIRGVVIGLDLRASTSVGRLSTNSFSLTGRFSSPAMPVGSRGSVTVTAFLDKCSTSRLVSDTRAEGIAPSGMEPEVGKDLEDEL